MEFVLSILLIIIGFLVFYILLLQQQLHNINKQLDKKFRLKTRQPINIELINKELNQLTVNINRCLKAEETLRLESVREEKRFKELITNVSHDLRTPLTAIKGYLQLMEKGELTEDQKHKLSVARKHCERLGSLIDHFYEYSYLTNIEPELHLDRINLTNLVTECLIESVPSLEEKNMTLDYEETIPIYVFADKELILRILQNLMRNCMQHAEGSIKVRLMMEEDAIISISNPLKADTRLDVDKLFDRFYVGDKARSNSTGLGLSIVKLLAEQMNGSVNATLEKNMIDIQITLPLCK